MTPGTCQGPVTGSRMRGPSDRRARPTVPQDPRPTGTTGGPRIGLNRDAPRPRSPARTVRSTTPGAAARNPNLREERG